MTLASDPWVDFGKWDGNVADLSALSALPDTLDPERWKHDPKLWTEERVGGFLWSKQVEIKESVRDHRYTAVPSCHDAGKSFIAADTILWWIDSHPIGEAFVVWTAPTYPQVNAIIGREIRQILRGSPSLGLRLLGDNQLVTAGDDPILVGYGRKPSDHNPTAFQGIHAKYVLVVVDEACGIPESLWNGVDALVTNVSSRVLAIGNPDDSSAHFARICEPGHKLGDGWRVIHVDGYDTPNFTGEAVPDSLRELLLSKEWVEERRRRWGEESALYESKVRGRFAAGAEDSIIPYSIAKAATGYTNAGWSDAGPGVLGCDIARDGSDESTIVSVLNGRVKIVDRFREPDLMRTADRIATELIGRGPQWKAVVDGDGIGGGVIDRLRQLDVNVVEYRGSGRARHRPRRFKNRRAEAWWALRLLLEDGALELPSGSDDADSLLRDLTVPKQEHDAAGRIQVELKDKVRKRLGHSPDIGDALVMAVSEGASAPISAERLTRAGSPAAITAGLLKEKM